MIHQLIVNDKTREGKLIIEMIRAIKPSKKSVKIFSEFDYRRLILSEGEPITQQEMERLTDEAENSKGISLKKFKEKMDKKIVAAYEGRTKKAS